MVQGLARQVLNIKTSARFTDFSGGYLLVLTGFSWCFFTLRYEFR